MFVEDLILFLHLALTPAQDLLSQFSPICYNTNLPTNPTCILQNLHAYTVHPAYRWNSHNRHQVHQTFKAVDNAMRLCVIYAEVAGTFLFWQFSCFTAHMR